MPVPASHGRQWRNCFAVACTSVGYHVSGMLMVRSSRSRTTSVSRWTVTDSTFAFEKLIPCLQHLRLFALGNPQGAADFGDFQTFRPRQLDRIQPELGCATTFVNVHMRRFIAFFREEVE